MRLDQLNGVLAFVTVAEKRGFSAAARALGISPSALSQAVRTLEARLETALVARTTRAVSLTEAGEALYRRCAPGLREAIAALNESARAKGEVVGTLRCSVPHISLPYLAPVVLELRARFPHLNLEVIVDDRFVDLIRDGYDVGIRLFESTEKDMVAVRVAPAFRFVIVGAPTYLKQHGRPEHPRELLQHECIGFRAMSTGALYQWEFERRGREFKVPVTGLFVTNDAGLMVRAAVLGLGLAYVPDFSAQSAIASKSLETVLDEFTPSAPGLFLYFPEQARQQPKMQALLQAVRTVLKSDMARQRATPR
ncbi:MAG TPA: LysR family transcriptional regulator [Polyangiaceae bacterium]|nr:LysR family transcriptional regulator [Polyangiaceae bacterium]